VRFGRNSGEKKLEKELSLGKEMNLGKGAVPKRTEQNQYSKGGMVKPHAKMKKGGGMQG